MGSRLVFKPGNHTYWLDRQKVPGVTTTINRAHEKPGLVGAAAKETALWAADNVASFDPDHPGPWVKEAKGHYRELWDAAAERGTFLHDAARQLVAGEILMPETDGIPWPDDVRKSAEQLARFMDEWDMQPLFTERPVFHERHIWAGTVDAVAQLRSGGRWLLDYKTGSTGIYPKDALQLATYRQATHVQMDTPNGLEDWPMPGVDNAACVWIQPDFYELTPVLADWASYDVFLHMLPVANWTTWKREDCVGLPLDIGEAS